MEIDHKKEMRSKIHGYHLAFNTHMPQDTWNEGVIGFKYKIKNKKIPFSDVKKQVADIREKREREKERKLQEENKKYLKRMKYIQNTHDKLRQEKLAKLVD